MARLNIHECKLAEKPVRFYNFVIDFILNGLLYITIMMIATAVLIIIGEENKIGLIEAFSYPLSYFSYYFLFEYFSGRTPGKRFTKSFVVKKDGTKPGIQNLIVRSFLRFFLFDSMSYLFGSSVGIHDLLSNTRVVRKFEN